MYLPLASCTRSLSFVHRRGLASSQNVHNTSLRNPRVLSALNRRWQATSAALRPSPSEAHEDIEPSEHDLKFGYYSVILPEEPLVWGTSHIIPRTVPPQIQRPHYVPDWSSDSERPPALGMKARRKLITNEDDLARLRNAAKLAANALRYAGSQVHVGRSTDALDAAVHDYILAHGAYPSPLLYKGFPKSCCTSVNNIVTHGIPDNRSLQDGDIVNVDITVFLDGFHGDTSRTFLVGDVDDKGCELVRATEAALEAGLAACGPGRPFRDIARAIDGALRGRGTDYCVSPMFTGHGIGEEFHRQPWIYHTLNEEPEVMEEGDCFTIEPAVIQGKEHQAFTFPDGWTVSTENCARAAQSEHMVLITKTGAEVLTRIE